MPPDQRQAPRGVRDDATVHGRRPVADASPQAGKPRAGHGRVRETVQRGRVDLVSLRGALDLCRHVV